MEAIVRPRDWSDFPAKRDGIFRKFRSPLGDQAILQENEFIERVLPNSVLRGLTDEEMQAYRSPYTDAASRLPMLAWPRELPIAGEPADVVAAVERYGRWLASSSLPKLLISAEPGSLLIGRGLEFCRRWPNQTEVAVRGMHFIQEDAPDEIGSALQRFLRGLRASD
jgi:haloalkane dehalogenase